MVTFCDAFWEVKLHLKLRWQEVNKVMVKTNRLSLGSLRIFWLGVIIFFLSVWVCSTRFYYITESGFSTLKNFVAPSFNSTYYVWSWWVYPTRPFLSYCSTATWVPPKGKKALPGGEASCRLFKTYTTTRLIQRTVNSYESRRCPSSDNGGASTRAGAFLQKNADIERRFYIITWHNAPEGNWINPQHFGVWILVPYQSFSCFLCKKIVFERDLERQKAEQFFIVRLVGWVLCNRFKKDPCLVGLISYVKKMTDYNKLSA